MLTLNFKQEKISSQKKDKYRDTRSQSELNQAQTVGGREEKTRGKMEGARMKVARKDVKTCHARRRSRQTDDAQRELRRLSPSMLILENV